MIKEIIKGLVASSSIVIYIIITLPFVTYEEIRDKIRGNV